MASLREKNDAIKELRNKLKDTASRASTWMELDNALAGVADRKAFILLLDMYETEKELSREFFEELIDKSVDVNNHIFLYMENNSDVGNMFAKVFSVGNIKSVLIFAVAVGVVIAIATNDAVAPAIVDKVIEKKEK
jgi:hypothetical protein